MSGCIIYCLLGNSNKKKNLSLVPRPGQTCFRGEECGKLCVISLSNDTARRRYVNFLLIEQVIRGKKHGGLFSIQLDESTDVQFCSQLMVFVRYVHSGDLKEEFLFCDDLELTTKGEGVLEKL